MKKQHSNREAYEKKKVSKPETSPDSLNKEMPKVLAAEESSPTPSQKKTQEKSGTTEVHYRQEPKSSKRKKSSTGKMVLFCSVIVAVVILAFVLIYSAFGGDAPYQASFTLNSSTATVGSKTITMDSTVMIDKGIGMVPVVDAQEILPITVKWEDGKENATIKGNGVKIKVNVNDAKVNINGENVKWNHAPIVEDKVLYLPLVPLCEALGYGTAVAPSVSKVNVFTPDDKNKIPTVTFTTDKDSYDVGETVKYAIDAKDPDDDEIVEFQWTNHQETFEETGEFTITLSVMDAKGAWSEKVSKTITINSPDEE